MSLEIDDHALDDGAVVYSGPASELAADEARVRALAGASAEEWSVVRAAIDLVAGRSAPIPVRPVHK